MSATKTTEAKASSSDAMPYVGTTTLDMVRREQEADAAYDAAKTGVFTLAQAVAVTPKAPGASVVIVGPHMHDTAKAAAHIRAPDREAKTVAALHACAPWLAAVQARWPQDEVFIAGGSVARALCGRDSYPKDVDVFAADPAGVADALGEIVEAAFRGAGADTVLRIDTPHAVTWVPELVGRRLCASSDLPWSKRFPTVQLIRRPCASVSDCLTSFDLAPCQVALTAGGLRFSAAGARHFLPTRYRAGCRGGHHPSCDQQRGVHIRPEKKSYLHGRWRERTPGLVLVRRCFSLPDPAQVGTQYLARLYKYSRFTAFALPAGTKAVRVGALSLTVDGGRFRELKSADPTAKLHEGAVYELDREREYETASLADLEADNARALREGRPGGVARFEGWDRFERLAARIAEAASRFDYGPAAAALGADLVPRLAGVPAAELGTLVAALLRSEMARLAAALPAAPPTAELFGRRVPVTAAEMFVRA